MTQLLLVEPDPMLARTINDYLMPDIAVKICENSQLAISYADTQKPNIIVLELAIPQHNGVAFLQEFRTYQDWLDVPIIIYSRIPREDTGLVLHEWQKLGVMDYLYKPTAGLADLRRAIAGALD